MSPLSQYLILDVHPPEAILGTACYLKPPRSALEGHRYIGQRFSPGLGAGIEHESRRDDRKL